MRTGPAEIACVPQIVPRTLLLHWRREEEEEGEKEKIRAESKSEKINLKHKALRKNKSGTIQRTGRKMMHLKTERNAPKEASQITNN